jgi:hypothetical protein
VQAVRVLGTDVLPALRTPGVDARVSTHE